MKPGSRDALLLFLCLIPLSVLGAGWVNAGLAAEAPITPLQDTLSDRGADRVLAVEVSLDREPPLTDVAQKQIPIAESSGDEQRCHALETAPSLPISGADSDATDNVLVPAAPFGSADGGPVVQSLIPPSAQGSASMHPQR
jgi:hypothetical protein